MLWSGCPIKARAAAIAALLAAPSFVFSAAAPVYAQEKLACEQFAWPVQREQALFKDAALQTLPSGSVLDSAGRGVALELAPYASAPFLLPPGRQPKTPDSYGGIVTIANLPQAGTWQVTTSAEAWIEVIQNGKAIVSSAHTGKRDCEGIRKSVRFELQPGPVTIQISGATAPSIKLAVLPAD